METWLLLRLFLLLLLPSWFSDRNKIKKKREEKRKEGNELSSLIHVGFLGSQSSPSADGAMSTSVILLGVWGPGSGHLASGIWHLASGIWHLASGSAQRMETTGDDVRAMYYC